MSELKLFLQFEGHRPIELIQLPESATAGDVLRAAAGHGAIVEEAFVFLVDIEEPLDPDESLHARGVKDRHRVHVHRCRKVKVALTFVDTTAHHEFVPSATVETVKRWFVHHLKMSSVDAAEHVLQVSGTTERPDPDVQIGSLVHGACALAFTLVPTKRIEG